MNLKKRIIAPILSTAEPQQINLETNAISSDATGVERISQTEQESENSSLVVRFKLHI